MSLWNYLNDECVNHLKGHSIQLNVIIRKLQQVYLLADTSLSFLPF